MLATQKNNRSSGTSILYILLFAGQFIFSMKDNLIQILLGLLILFTIIGLMNSPSSPIFMQNIFDRSKGEVSTAQKFYNLEQSQRRYEQLVEENIWLRSQIDRSSYQKPAIPYCPNCSHSQSIEHKQISRGQDLVLWSMLQRNKYLEQKTDKLRGQYQRQSHTISSIKQSQKWKSRFTCNPNQTSCYEQKYLRLLRVRSPFY